MNSNFQRYLKAFAEGLLAKNVTPDNNPHYGDDHAQIGWWAGKLLWTSFGDDFTPDTLLYLIQTSAWYWKAHAQGMAAYQQGVSLIANPYSPKHWDSFQCPEKSDRVAWNGWAAGWRYNSLCNNFSQPGT